jgi:hypothetical protein
LPTMVGAAARDDAAIAAPRIRLPAINALRMRCNAHTDAAASRFINHAGNPAVLDLILKKWAPYRKLCALAFQRVCPDQTLCKIAQCEPQCQRNGGVFARFLQDLAHIRAHSSNGRQRGECDAKRAAQSCRHYKPTIE